jgi:hypothetical protein
MDIAEREETCASCCYWEPTKGNDKAVFGLCGLDGTLQTRDCTCDDHTEEVPVG